MQKRLLNVKHFISKKYKSIKEFFFDFVTFKVQNSFCFLKRYLKLKDLISKK